MTGSNPHPGLRAVCQVCGDGHSTLVRDQFGRTACRFPCNDPRCSFCDGFAVGGRRLADGRVRCGLCDVSGIDSDFEMVPVVAEVRDLLHSFGIRLPNAVRVKLVSVAALETEFGPGVLGVTRTLIGAVSSVRSVEIVEGLPATAFGDVLAHEMAHGWLAGCPQVPRSAMEEEGLCELVSSWWLVQRRGEFAAYLLRRKSLRSDPIYGDGFREMSRRAGSRTPTELVQYVFRHGRL